MRRPTPRRPRRTGSLFVEILVAVTIFALISIALFSSFSVGVRQTQLVKSHVSARAVAEWGLSQARAVALSGGYRDDTCPPVATPQPPLHFTDLTADARQRFRNVTDQLRDLTVRRMVFCQPIPDGADDQRAYRIEVTVDWSDPGQELGKQVRLTAYEAEEI